MRSRTWIIAGLAAAAVIVAGAVLVNQLPGHPTAVGASTSEPTPVTNSTSVAGAPSEASPPPATPAPDPSGPPQSKRFTTEVIPGDGPGVGLPATKPLPEPVSRPLPKTASAVGEIAKGFPSAVLPTAPKSSITTSSVATQGAHLQATMTAKSTLAMADVLAFYRTALAKYGMYDTAAPALGGATALTFKRGDNSVTITTTKVAGGTSYILYGAFTAKG